MNLARYGQTTALRTIRVFGVFLCTSVFGVEFLVNIVFYYCCCCWLLQREGNFQGKIQYHELSWTRPSFSEEEAFFFSLYKYQI